MPDEEISSGTIKDGEYHPAADDAMRYIKGLPIDELMTWIEAFASSAMAGNRLAEICSETLRRLTDNEPVSDRYLLGLAWTIRNMKDGK